MREEPMFIWIKGRGRRHLSPATPKGRLIMIVLILVLHAPVPLLVWGASASGISWLPLMVIAWIGVGLFAFLRFARSRSTVIDLDEVKRDWPAFQAWRDKGRPR